jgi:hypothetical protein
MRGRFDKRSSFPGQIAAPGAWVLSESERKLKALVLTRFLRASRQPLRLKTL